MKTYILIFLLSAALNALAHKTCDIETLKPMPNVVDDFEDVGRDADYIVFDNSEKECLFILRPNQNNNGYVWADQGRPTFWIYNDNRDFCMQPKSVWRIFRAGNSSPNHEVRITRVDKPEMFNAGFSAVRDSNAANVAKDGQFTFMICP